MQAFSSRHMMHQSFTAAWDHWVESYQVPSEVSRLHGWMRFTLQAFDSCHIAQVVPLPLGNHWAGPSQSLRNLLKGPWLIEHAGRALPGSEQSAKVTQLGEVHCAGLHLGTL